MHRLSTLVHQPPQQRRDSVRKTFIRRRVQQEKKVLIIEDCDLVLDAYKKHIDPHGARMHAPKAVSTIMEAMNLFRVVKPDIVVCDLSLHPGGAGMEGIAILKLIKKVNPAVTVALSTSRYNRDESKMDADFLKQIKSAGFDAIFEKMDVEGIGRFISSHI